MHFMLGKELRTLVVFEFVVLFYHKFIHPFFEVEEDSDYVFMTPTSSSIQSEEIGVQPNPEYQQHHKNRKRYVRICSAIRNIVQLLSLCIYFATLVLLHKNLQECDNPTSFMPIYLGCVIIGMNIYFWVLSLEPFPDYFAQWGGSDEEEETTLSIVSTAFHKLQDRKSVRIRKLQDAIGRWRKSHGMFVQILIDGIGYLINTVMDLSSVVLYALTLYFFATSIRLAYPEELEAMCGSNDSLIRNVMLLIPISVIIHYFINILPLLFPRTMPFGEAQVFRLLQSFLEVFLYISTTVLYTILSIRSTKWRGEQLSLYEATAIVVSLPTINVLLE